jgi:hypothetical protein
VRICRLAGVSDQKGLFKPVLLDTCGD